MTETLSHIALRRLNGPQASDWYSPFEGVTLRLTEEGALAIHAPAVCADELVTNDIAELHEDGRFRILGRKDNVINSGGVKIQTEDVEAQLLPAMPCPFQITAAPDEHYGEVVVMLVEGEVSESELEKAFSFLHAYSRPKHVFSVTELPRTGSGKPDRAGARALAKSLVEEAHDRT
jgi:O-succinylbenzoic acid--CoA ligase